MPIYQGSRYETADVVPVENGGVYRPTVFPTRTVADSFDYTNYQVVYGDRLETIANTAYGDPELWWVIADANPTLSYPDDLVAGSVLVVPVVVDQ